MAKIEKILFVDDDTICSFLNESLVKDMGIAKEVVLLQNAEAALAYIKKHYSGGFTKPSQSPDMLFLDIKMPAMDGFEFMQALNKLKNINRSMFSIIILTTAMNETDEDRAALLCDEILACLTKPLAADDIHKLLEQIDCSCL